MAIQTSNLRTPLFTENYLEDDFIEIIDVSKSKF